MIISHILYLCWHNNMIIIAFSFKIKEHLIFASAIVCLRSSHVGHQLCFQHFVIRAIDFFHMKQSPALERTKNNGFCRFKMQDMQGKASQRIASSQIL